MSAGLEAVVLLHGSYERVLDESIRRISGARERHCESPKTPLGLCSRQAVW